jgi:hypothetical protein
MKAYYFLVPIVTFTVFFFSHLVVFYFFDPAEKVSSLFNTFYFFSLVNLFILFWKLKNDQDIDIKKKFICFLNGSLLFTLLFIGYLEFYFTVDRSITFRMLIVSKMLPEEEFTKETMLRVYDTENIINSRFVDLEYGGYIKETSNGSFKITTKGEVVYYIYDTALKALKFRKEEFFRSTE